MRSFSIIAALLMFVVPAPHSAHAQGRDTDGGRDTSRATREIDPFDPFDFIGADELFPSSDDEGKTAQQLLEEARVLLSTERLLDGRTKLLKALKKDPTDPEIYSLLAGYYLVHVGHYRLALKYCKRAEELFQEKHGPPPYKERALVAQHAEIIYYLSQIKLNLDNYQGALDELDRFQSLGYMGEWYPGSRAWILMKLGNIKEAIRIARMGILAGLDTGRNLNMLGILLSMDGNPQEALDVFRKAIADEFSQGRLGQPATPLNNAGEVYRELFEEDRAESTFLRATSLPDGCEHILPALNVALLYIEQLKFSTAAQAIDGFESCIAQYPLRNNEEHTALMNLARGRIDLHTGRIDRAIKRLETALQNQQWFGKIGTNENDLVVGATISLAQALERKNNHLRFYRPTTWSEWLTTSTAIAENKVRSWWLFRRARQILISELKDIEDLSIRNTDSLLEYPTLGDVLQGISRTALLRRLDAEREHDQRTPARLYYDAYEGESAGGLLGRGERAELLDSVIEHARPKYDDFLRSHAILLRLREIDPNSQRYRDLAYRVFFTAPALMRNYGVQLPVRMNLTNASWGLRRALRGSAFAETESADSKVCTLTASTDETSGRHTLALSCPANPARNRKIGENTSASTTAPQGNGPQANDGADPNNVVNTFTDAVFREEISNGGNS